MTPKICLALDQYFDADIENLLGILSNFECEILDIEKVDDSEEFDVLLYFVGENLDSSLKRWLELANRSNRDFLITSHDSNFLGWSDFQVSLSLILENNSACQLLLDVVSGKIDKRSKNPHIIFTDEISSSPVIASTIDELAGLLRDSTVRVLGVSEDLRGIFKIGKYPSRLDYDLARYVKGTIKRFEASVIKMTVEFSGGEASISPGVEFRSLSELVFDRRSSNLITLLGAPGSGKSVQLQQFDVELALRSLRQSKGQSETPIAFCVNLGEHAVSGKEQEDPVVWLKRRWKARFDDPAELDNFETVLKNYHVVFLLDGFNEIPFESSSERRNWMNKWKACIHELLLPHPKTRVLVACRPRDLVIGMGGEDLFVTTSTVQPLGATEILEIARRRNVVAHNKLKIAIYEDESLVQLYKSPLALNDYLEAVSEQVPKSQSEIFWLRIRSVLQRELNIGIGLNRLSWLPDSSLNNFLVATNLRDAVARLLDIPLLVGLGALAIKLASMNSPDEKQRAAIDTKEFVQWASCENKLENAGDKSEFRGLSEDLSLLVENEGFLKFSHHTLQDFFCIVGLSTEKIIERVDISGEKYLNFLQPISEVIQEMGVGDTLQLLPSTGFEEIFSLLIEVEADALGKALQVNPWLVAELLNKNKREENAILASNVKEVLRSEILQSDDVRLSIASLNSIGLVMLSEDSREDTHVPVMSQIPKGNWKLGLGANSKKKNQLVKASRNLIKCKLDQFEIGKYPITNIEYQSFVDAGGYEREKYWTPEGWRWKSGTLPVQPIYDRWIKRRDKVAEDSEKPLRLLDEKKVSILEAAAIIRFSRMNEDEIAIIASTIAQDRVVLPAFFNNKNYNNPLQPVVGISFHEAKAYCRWLSEYTGKNFRLPTEDEWEVAAIYASSIEPSIYSPMDQFNIDENWGVECGNVAELHVGAPTPVGAFETISQRENGLPCDMRGNVFEWVSDLVNEVDDWCFVVKGGSFRHLVRRSHPGYRGRGDNTSRNDDNGFRVACSI